MLTMTDREMQTDAALGKMDHDEWIAIMRWSIPKLIRENQRFVFYLICRRAESIKSEKDRQARDANRTSDATMTEYLRDLFEKLDLALHEDRSRDEQF